MSRERHEELARLFQAAVQLPVTEQEEYLSQACQHDPTLADEVRVLLQHDQETLGALDGPASRVSENATRKPPDHIGGFQIIRPLGEGGMGLVFEARQRNPNRSVALKVMRSQFPTEELLERFQQESEALGQLDHPGIARVYSAGIGDGDREPPWLAMEFIEGEDLRSHARSKAFSPAAIAALVAEVCDAVEHAHQRGIVHRDLKPSNILVDSTGRPRILDFGVSRMLSPDPQESRMTSTGQVVGTLPYMSPEQAEGGESVDTRSDVYALGVILFELLANRLPIEIKGCSFAEACRRITTQEPPDLSTLAPGVAQDLATITTKALDKDPHHRFQSASDFAADLRRFLRNEPIVSRPHSTIYNLKKFAVRNRGLVIGMSLAAMALVVGAIISLVYAIQARGAKDAADKEARNSKHQTSIARLEADSSNNFVNFILDTLRGMDPNLTTGEEPTLREAMDAVAAGVENLDAKPQVIARMHGFLGDMYRALGRGDLAGEHLDRAAAIYSKVEEPDQRAAEDLYRVAWFCYTQMRLDEAEALLLRTKQILEDLGNTSHKLMGDVLCTLGEVNMRRRDFQAARGWVDRSRIHREANIEGDHENKAVTYLVLSQIAIAERKYDEATAMAQASLDMRERIYGEEHPLIAESLQQLSSPLFQQNRLEEAGQYMAKAMAIRERTLGTGHPALASGYFNLARAEQAQGNLREALQWIRKIEGLYDAMGPTHRLRAPNELLAGSLHYGLGEFEDALPRLRAAKELYETAVGPEGTYVLTSLSYIGLALGKMGKLTEALDTLKDLEHRARSLPEDAPMHVKARYHRMMAQAALLDRDGNGAEAEDLRARAAALNKQQD